jgi:hypothetical protein
MSDRSKAQSGVFHFSPAGAAGPLGLPDVIETPIGWTTRRHHFSALAGKLGRAPRTRTHPRDRATRRRRRDHDPSAPQQQQPKSGSLGCRRHYCTAALHVKYLALLACITIPDNLLVCACPVGSGKVCTTRPASNCGTASFFLHCRGRIITLQHCEASPTPHTTTSTTTCDLTACDHCTRSVLVAQDTHRFRRISYLVIGISVDFLAPIPSADTNTATHL